tara:strand:+ start:5105 stop:5440 length:336 start_codon:yes stop_codon:yes gene_type:complete
MFNIKKINNLEEENNMKHINTISKKIVQGAKELHPDSIDYQSYISVADLLEEHQFRAVQIVLDGLDSSPREDILKIISEDEKVWNIMFEPLKDGQYLLMRVNKDLTNSGRA